MNVKVAHAENDGVPDMEEGITRDEVKQAVEQAEAGFPHEECLRCDCLYGFLAQLELDAAEDVSDLTGRFKVPRGEMPGCLGCDPCSPGSLFADYLRQQQNRRLGIE
jgi:hypothetical protein